MEQRSDAIRIGIPPRNYLEPLFHALRGSGSPYPLTEAEPPTLAHALRQGDLGAALLSPIEYARLANTHRVIPSLAALSAGESGVARLIFRDHLSEVSTIAISPASFSGEIVLAHIVMAEKYEVHPKFVPVQGGIEDGLRAADAVLLAGNAHLHTPDEGHSWIDLVDEWTDITEMPYVHGVWMAREGSLNPSSTKAFIESSEAGVRNYRSADATMEEHLAEYFGYTLHDDAAAALKEFLQMAFFHGVLEELVEPRYLSLT